MTTTRDQLKAAIFGQESSSGGADTSEENYAGARGPMQVTRQTFDGMKKVGLIPADWDHANPAHTKEAGNRLIDHLADKYGDDPLKVAVAYYAGEKAVKEDGSIVDYHDLKNPRAPTTLQYGHQILTRMGLTPEAVEAGGGPVGPAGPRPAADDFTAAMPGKVGKNSKMVMVPAADGGLPYSPDPYRARGDGPVLGQEQAAEQAARAVEQARVDTTTLDSARAGYMHQGISGIILRQIAEKTDFPPTPGYDPREASKKLYEGTNAEEQEVLDQAHSADHAAYLNEMIQTRRADMEKVAAGGQTQALVSQLVGGLPEGYLTGLGTAKSIWMASRLAGKTLGATALAEEGRTGAAVASSLLENTAGNVGSLALQQQLDPYVTTADYPMAVGMSLLGTALHAPGLRGTASAAHLKLEGDRIMKEAADYTDNLRAEAFKNLGEDAKPDAVAAEMSRIDAERGKAQLQSAQAPLPRERELPGREVFEAPEEKPAATAGEGEKPPTEEPAPVTSEGAVPMREAATAHAAVDDGLVHDTEHPFDKLHLTEQMRREAATPVGDKFIKENFTEGQSLAGVERRGAGVHAQPDAGASVPHRAAIEAITKLAKKFLPDSTISVGLMKAGSPRTTRGQVLSLGNTHLIALHPELPPRMAVTTAIHELGHAVFHQYAVKIPPDLLEWMGREHGNFLKGLREGKAAARFQRFSEGSSDVIDPATGSMRGKLPDTAYVASFDEYTAEAFVRHIQKAARDAGSELDIGAAAKRLLTELWDKVKDLYARAMKSGYLPKDEAFHDFFTRVMENRLHDEAIPVGEATEMPLAASVASHATITGDPIAHKYGFELMPQDTTIQKARYKAVRDLYARAEDPAAPWNNVDEKRLKVLTDNSVFNVASTGVQLLKSKNPVARMLAHELLESSTGASGRHSTAAMAKFLNERKYLGNTMNEARSSYVRWRNQNGGNAMADAFNGDHWRRFNRAVAEELESRRTGYTGNGPANEHVVQAANAYEKAYERMRLAQIETKTIGWGALPESSVGYMPHRMSPEKIRNMTNEQGRVLHAELADQFISRSGFDITFSANLAAKYIERIRQRGLGGYESPINVYHTGAADVVEDALHQMGMTKPEIHAAMQKYVAGGAGHTKKRLNLNLLAEHQTADGKTFRLLDLFETDQEKLLRSQSGRVSGEVALARHGVMGRPGLGLMRDALSYGEDSAKISSKELEAFDQVSAEFLNAPFGNAGGPWLNRAMMFNSLARLGGMGFTQMAEYINAAAHIGVGHTLNAVGGFARLRSEAKALARGEKVHNPLLESIETHGGAEFGAEVYKMNFPFAEESTQYSTYGRDTPGFADKLLRGGVNLQAKLSFWRSIHAAQQRGLAEQVVLKAVRFIREGGEDKALADMGINAGLAERLRADIDHIAPLGADGKPSFFDISKARDLGAAEDFVQSVHRGVSQMIQGTYIGETGKWAHSGLMKFMTQFRTFSIISVEKQWARQVGNHGTGAALGILMGSMAAAAPIYMVRTIAAAANRKDKEEYLKRQLSPLAIARATLNYVALSGLAGDFMDAFSATTGIGGATGGRAGTGTDFFGNTVAPGVGLVNDLYKGVQNTRNGTNPHDLLKSLPFARLPYLIPAIDGLQPEH